VPQILEALFAASKKGLRIPIVYNTSGYDPVGVLSLLDGVVDIYLPDIRYQDNSAAKRFSNAPDYVTINREAIKEMHRQVGGLVLDEEGIAQKGLIIRHLVLPNDIASSKAAFTFIAAQVSKNTHISLMSQFHPVYRASEFPEINRRITREEYEKAFDSLLKCGLSNGWVQEPSKEMDLRLLGTNIKKMS
jgi:putative pyruvate formate lyase activating enzyme